MVATAGPAGRGGWWRTWCRPARRPRTSRELRAHLRRTLPEYMVPAAFVALDRAAADRQRQAGPARRCRRPTPGGRERRCVAPRTAARGGGRGLGRGARRCPRSGAEDNFFDLGGDSILASGWPRGCGPSSAWTCPRAPSSPHPTVAGLAGALAAGHRPARRRSPPGRARRRAAALFAQQRLWFLDEFEPGTAEYITFTALRLRGRSTWRRCAAALDRLVAPARVAADHLRRRGRPGGAGRPPAAELPLPVDLTLVGRRRARRSTRIAGRGAPAARSTCAADRWCGRT